MADDRDAIIRDAALAYAQRGLAVFPLVPGEKRPLTDHGFKDATTDAAQIESWWREHPDANIGIACGASGLVVIDGDTKKGHDPGAALAGLLNGYRQLPKTRRCTTPSGGWHMYFRAPEGVEIRNSAGTLRPGLDVRGVGGYVVAPPSAIGGMEYKWVDDDPVADLPEWLADLLTRSPPLVAAVGDADIPEGARNQTLTSLAGSMRRRGMSLAGMEAALLAENAARCCPPLAEAEVMQIARSVSQYPPEAVTTQPQPSAQPPLRFEIRPTTLDVLRTPIPPREFVIEPLFPRGALTVLVGANGISKSTLMLDVDIHVAAGRQWCGLRTMAGKAFFVSLEDPYEEVMRRVQADIQKIDSKERPAIERALCENLVILGCDDIELTVTQKENYGGCIVRRDAVELIASRCQGAILVVLETASRIHGGDESNEDLAALAKAGEAIARATGAAVVLISHVSKAAAREKMTDAYAGRGGGSLPDYARSVLVMTQLSAEEVRKEGVALDGLAVAIGSPIIALHHPKASYAAKRDEPLFFVRLPGPILRYVPPPDSDKAFGERLLAFINERHAAGDARTGNELEKQDPTRHRVPQRLVKKTLDKLEQQGRIRIEKVGKRKEWVPV